MKVPTNDEVEDYTKAISIGGLKGVGVGAVISVGAAAFLKRRTSYFTNISGLQRSILYLLPGLFCGFTAMELSSRAFEEKRREELDGFIEKKVVKEEADFSKKLKEFGQNNQYKIVVGGWAASIIGSFWYINKDKYMTRSQKIVQARVYAQGATVALLLATVFLSVQFGGTPEDKRREQKQAASHSWENDLQYVEPHDYSKDKSSTPVEGSTDSTDSKENLPSKPAPGTKGPKDTTELSTAPVPHLKQAFGSGDSAKKD